MGGEEACGKVSVGVLGRRGSLPSYVGDCVLAGISPDCCCLRYATQQTGLVTLLELRHIEKSIPQWNSLTLELSSEFSDQPGELELRKGGGKGRGRGKEKRINQDGGCAFSMTPVTW